MGKVFLVILLIGVAVFFVYRQNYKPLSEEEQKVKAIELNFIAASARFMGSAGGGAAVELDEVEAAAVRVQKIRNELALLMGTLKDEKAVLKAEELRAKIDEFIRKNDIK